MFFRGGFSSCEYGQTLSVFYLVLSHSSENTRVLFFVVMLEWYRAAAYGAFANAREAVGGWVDVRERMSERPL